MTPPETSRYVASRPLGSDPKWNVSAALRAFQHGHCDATTSDRPYKEGRSSIDALKVIHGLRGKKFDQSLAEAFIRHISLYPRGSIVELRSGEVGLVAAYTEYRHLPL